MKKHRFRLKVTFNPSEHKEEIDPVSLTVKGEALTIRELLIRYQQGQQLAQFKPVYFDVEDINEINQFFQPNIDLTDLDKMTSHINNLQSMIEKAKVKQDKENNPEPEPEPEPEPKPKPEV